MYRVGAPWQGNEPKLPNNYKMALRRLENTEKKLVRSPAIATAYCAIINQYIDKGYIKKVGDQNRNKSKWFLPHFPVIRPDKETTNKIQKRVPLRAEKIFKRSVWARLHSFEY